MKIRVGHIVGVALPIAGLLISSAAMLIIFRQEVAGFAAVMAAVSTMAGFVLGLLSKRLTKAASKFQKGPRVFLSYNWEDKIFAALLAASLRNRGAKVWLDNERVKPGDDFLSEIERAMGDSTSIVALLSSRRSEFLDHELRLARKKGLRIVPVLTSRDKPPQDLADLRYIDLRGGGETAVDEIVEAVTRS